MGEEEKDAAMEQVQQLVTWVQYANDEGDPGMGLELGLDLFCHGGQAVEGTAHHLLTVAYELLDREEFGEVAKAHLARRVRGGQDTFARRREKGINQVHLDDSTPFDKTVKTCFQEY